MQSTRWQCKSTLIKTIRQNIRVIHNNVNIILSLKLNLKASNRLPLLSFSMHVLHFIH